MKYSSLALMCGLAISCGESSDSYLDYAHSKARSATISPLGGIKILQSDVDFSF